MGFSNFIILIVSILNGLYLGSLTFGGSSLELGWHFMVNLASIVFIFYYDLLTKFSWIGFLLVYCLVLILDLLFVPKSVFEVRLTALWNANWLFLVGAVVYFWYKKIVFFSIFDTEVNTLPFFFMERLFPLFPEINLFFHVGIDGVSLWLILLTLFLLPVCILLSWEVITVRVKLYYFLLFLVIFLFVELVFGT